MRLPINKAFTLLELLVVITIIGILSSIVVVSMSGGAEEAGISKGKAYAQQVHALLGHEAVIDFNFNENAYNTCSGLYDACDTSGYGNHGTFYGDAHFVQSDIDGYALSFDGTGDYVNCGKAMTGLVDFSISLWINTSQVAAGSARYNDPAFLGTKQGSGDSNDFVLTNYNGKIAWYDELVAGSNSYDTGISVADGKWHHIVVTRSGASLSFYIDSVFKGKDTTGTDGVRDDDIEIGRALWSGSLYFSGLIDDVRVYSEHLSLPSIRKLYVQGSERLAFKDGALGE
jgi:prepilin-type N-terminal cleavage/methylation domain-containing protein